MKMKESLNNQNKEETEGAYEQFDIDDIFFQDKKLKKKKIIFIKKINKIYIDDFYGSFTFAFIII